MGADFDMRIEYQLQVYASAQSLVPIADAKAAAIMAANLAFVAAVVGHKDFLVTVKHIGLPDGNSTATLLAVLFFASCIVSVLSALMVIFPRFTPTKARTQAVHLTFFRDVASHDGPEGYHKTVAALSSEEILQEMCFQSYVLSRILVAKYSYTRAALIGLVGAFLFWLAFLMLGFRS